LVKTFDPLLRPNAEIPKRPVQGVVVDAGHGGGAGAGAVVAVTHEMALGGTRRH